MAPENTSDMFALGWLSKFERDMERITGKHVLGVVKPLRSKFLTGVDAFNSPLQQQVREPSRWLASTSALQAPILKNGSEAAFMRALRGTRGLDAAARLGGGSSFVTDFHKSMGALTGRTLGPPAWFVDIDKTLRAIAGPHLAFDKQLAQLVAPAAQRWTTDSAAEQAAQLGPTIRRLAREVAEEAQGAALERALSSIADVADAATVDSRPDSSLLLQSTVAALRAAPSSEATGNEQRSAALLQLCLQVAELWATRWAGRYPNTILVAGLVMAVLAVLIAALDLSVNLQAQRQADLAGQREEIRQAQRDEVEHAEHEATARAHREALERLSTIEAMVTGRGRVVRYATPLRAAPRHSAGSLGTLPSDSVVVFAAPPYPASKRWTFVTAFTADGQALEGWIPKKTLRPLRAL